MQIRTLAAVVIASGLALSTARTVSAAETYTVDTVHSAVIFRIKHMNTSYAYGRFNDITGSFAFDEQDPAKSRFDFQVKTGSVDTGNSKRDQHLKGPDFFNAVQFPTIAFKSTSVAKAGSDAYDVTGDLTLHGVTRPVTIKINKTGAGRGPVGKPIAGIETNFSIKRSEYKMSKMVGPVGDDVWLIVSVEGGR